MICIQTINSFIHFLIYFNELAILGQFVNDNYLKGFSRAGRKTRSKVSSFFNALQQQAGLYPPEGATDCINIGFGLLYSMPIPPPS